MPRIFILENVKGLTTHDSGNTFSIIQEQLSSLQDYTVEYLEFNTRNFGIPQNRPRIYIVGQLKQHARDITMRPINMPPITQLLDPNAPRDELTENMQNVVLNRLGRVKDLDQGANYIINVACSVNGFGSAMKEISPCLLAGAAKYYTTLYNRFLTTRELYRLQGFPEEFQLPANVPEKELNAAAGNAMSVNVLYYLLQGLLRKGVPMKRGSRPPSTPRQYGV